MPVGDVAGEALGGVIRFVGRVFVEFVLELLIQGTGGVVLKLLRPRHEPGETAAAIVGLVVWLVVAAVGYGLHAASST